MVNLRRATNSSKGTSSKYRALLLGLGLLNILLLISAIVIAVKCAKVKQDSLHVTHPAAVRLMNKLSDLRGNHSEVIVAEENAKQELQTAMDEHAKLQAQLAQQKLYSDDYQKHLESLRTEKSNLQANLSTLEGSCGKCPAGFVISNSTCYYFSSAQSSTIKKNWHDSRADCVSRGSDLVVIDDSEEQKFLSKKVKTLVSRDTWENGFWVGLTDIETEDHWVWINNVTETEPRYWMDGEPNNHGAAGEDCALITHSSTNPWRTRYDAKCRQHELYWLCEKQAE